MAIVGEPPEELIDRLLRACRPLVPILPIAPMPQAKRRDERRVLQGKTWREMHRALVPFDRRTIQKEKPAAR
ncbi:hypothetical protein AQ758_02115 [Burkholderia pseudomallei]|uniref:hypothetical protein n=1 Tax=Burkholderia pseudomallei TaxID=28450 RepID=UPI0009766B3A|nr:hypothetical protein [Burkholderia pseudomallei]OMT33383.1 hypothetical protein AQ757_14875 [Burkholderia pseudomallei]OMT38898.1 hypothetical protein AQ758_02115 [Burkholderia pseudomallei]